jgi:hypothetical protein
MKIQIINQSKVVLPMALCFLLCAPLRGYSRMAFWVPRVGPSHAAPVVDGNRLAAEYEGAWRLRLAYEPRSPYPAASVYLLTTEAHLYVFVENMPLHAGSSRVTKLSLTFDRDHGGGTRIGEGDLRFSVSETGVAQEEVGMATGDFRLVGRAVAAMSPSGSFGWNAEMQIPLSRLGGGDAGEILGFSIRHHDVHFDGTTYGDAIWPALASPDVPNTWADLVWLGGGSSGPVVVDRLRITQGLEFDLGAGVAYDLVAGKDSLVKAQLYTTDPDRYVISAECIVQRTPAGPEQICAADISPRFSLRSTPVGTMTGSPIDFWIPGSAVAQAGQYRFSLRILRDGESAPDIVRLGTRIFVEGADLRLLVVPWENPYDPRPAGWDDSFTAAALEAMREVNRLFPQRTGVGLARLTPAPAINGLRYRFWPVGRCASSITEFRACDTRGRLVANNALRLLNASLARLDPAQVDRFDFAVLLGATTLSGGGQAQFDWVPPSPGVGFDPIVGGISASVFAHEIAHCLGQVTAASPNLRGVHSENSVIPIFPDMPVVDTMRHTELRRPLSLMFWLVGNIDQTFTEGYEWNSLRAALRSLPAPVSGAVSAEGIRGQPFDVFTLAGVINKNDQVQVLSSARVIDLPLQLTPPSQNSPYRLVFLSANQTQLASLAFDLSFRAADPDDTNILDEVGVILTAPLPQGTAGIRIQKNAEVLYSQIFSAQPPQVGPVTAIPLANHQVEIKWSGVDPDSPNIHYNLLYFENPNSPPQLFAQGLTQTSFTLDARLLPATTQGQVMVIASDGLNTGRGMSNPFTILERPPIAAITYPNSNTTMIASQRIPLRAAAYDFSSGPLDSELTWQSDKDGQLGKGSTLNARLSAGTHLLTLIANAHSGSITTALQVVVLPDFDADGLPDAYEMANGLDPQNPLDASDDQDGDGLTAAAESAAHTNPVNEDSDGDGISDSEEIAAGTDPNHRDIQPAGPAIMVSEAIIASGCALNRTVNVHTAIANLPWTVSSDQPWLHVSGGGIGDGVVIITVDCKEMTDTEDSGNVILSFGAWIRVHIGEPTGSAPHNSEETPEEQLRRFREGFQFHPPAGSGWPPPATWIRIPSGLLAEALSISNVHPSDAGVYTYVASNQWGVVETPFRLTVLSDTPAIDYDAWRRRYWSINTPSSTTDRNADPDQDDMANFMEFALDSNPTIPSRHDLPQFGFVKGNVPGSFSVRNPSAASGGSDAESFGAFRIRIPKHHRGFDYDIRTFDSLGPIKPIDGGAMGPMMDVIGLADDLREGVIRDLMPAFGDRFFRFGVRPVPPPAGRSLRIGFYNVQMLPWTPSDDTTTGCCEDIENRAGRLGERIAASDYDVIALCEVFKDDDKRRLVAALRPIYPHFIDRLNGTKSVDFAIPVSECIDFDIGPFARELGFPIDETSAEDTVIQGTFTDDSGLMLFSKFPFESMPAELARPHALIPTGDNLSAESDGADWHDVAFTTFQDCQSCDCLANKGAGLVRIRNPNSGRIFNVVFTHLNTDSATAVRNNQLTQVRDMLTTVLGDRLTTEYVFMLGDLNINGDLASPERATSEWAGHFNTPGIFFSDAMDDAWEEQTNIPDLPLPRRDRGTTSGIHSDGGANARVDYLLINRPGAPLHNERMAVQHLARAYNLRAGDPLEPVAFGSAGRQDLSDHYGLIADINLEASHCNPQTALANPPLIDGAMATAIDGTLSYPGSMQWYRFDQPGTYSIIAEPTPDFQAEVFDTRDLSIPLMPYRGETRTVGHSGGSSRAPVFNATDSRLFVRVRGLNRAITGNYRLIVKRHEGTSPEDAVILVPANTNHFNVPAAAVGDPDRWFTLDTLRANSGRPQQLRFILRGGDGITYGLAVLNEARTSTIRSAAEDGEVIIDLPFAAGAKLFLRVSSPPPGTSFDIAWTTDLTQISPYHPTYFAGAAQGVEMTATHPSDTPDKFLGFNIEDDDDVTLDIRILTPDGLLSRSPALIKHKWDGGETVNVENAIATTIGAIRYLPDEQVVFRLIEDDSFTRGPNDIIESSRIPSLLPGAPLSRTSVDLRDADCASSGDCDGVYRFHFYISHGIPDRP